MNNTCCRCSLDQILQGTLHPGGLKLTERLAEVTLLKPGLEIVEIGCGTGVTSAFLALHYGCSVTGVDISHTQVASAREKAGNENPVGSARFITADSRRLPFPADRFDAGFSECSISMIRHKTEALEEIRRVLKPGGRVTIADLIRKDDKVIKTSERALPVSNDSFASFPCVENAESIDEYIKLFNDAGFHNVYVEDCSMVLKEALFRMRLRFGRTETLLKAIPCVCNECDGVLPLHEHRNQGPKSNIGYALITGTKE